jgi:GT2 family glycosyltransferase
MIASVVISTYNRADALEPTLRALADQDRPPSDYEVLVIDDGSSDDTPQVLASISTPYRLRTFRLPENRGVSAGRNVGLREAEGRYVVLLSDDLVVTRDFLSTHVATLERFPDAWVVGGFGQLESLGDTPFGRYLDGLESGFERARTGARVDGDIYEMTMPTARNLSLRRADLDAIGLFDERFRVTCEDQDLAHRAAQQGIRFLYNGSIRCVHNDQAADLRRYCRFQQRGARDGVRLFQKYPELHGHAPIARVNGYIRRTDGPALVARKLAKRVLSTRPALALLEGGVTLAERIGLPERWLARAYRTVIGLYMFRGFREGLREER